MIYAHKKIIIDQLIIIENNSLNCEQDNIQSLLIILYTYDTVICSQETVSKEKQISLTFARKLIQYIKYNKDGIIIIGKKHLYKEEQNSSSYMESLGIILDTYITIMQNIDTDNISKEKQIANEFAELLKYELSTNMFEIKLKNPDDSN